MQLRSLQDEREGRGERLRPEELNTVAVPTLESDVWETADMNDVTSPSHTSDSDVEMDDASEDRGEHLEPAEDERSEHG